MPVAEAEVLELRCGSCSAEFWDVRFVGDTDMITFGLASASSTERQEVAVGRMTPDELKRGAFDAALDQFSSRVSAESDDDFRAVHLIGKRGGFVPPAGTPFREFRQRYQPATLIYRCPSCGGEAVVTRELSPADFEAEGGKVRSFDDLTIR